MDVEVDTIAFEASNNESFAMSTVNADAANAANGKEELVKPAPAPKNFDQVWLEAALKTQNSEVQQLVEETVNRLLDRQRRTLVADLYTRLTNQSSVGPSSFSALLASDNDTRANNITLSANETSVPQERQGANDLEQRVVSECSTGAQQQTSGNTSSTTKPQTYSNSKLGDALTKSPPSGAQLSPGESNLAKLSPGGSSLLKQSPGSQSSQRLPRRNQNSQASIHAHPKTDAFLRAKGWHVRVEEVAKDVNERAIRKIVDHPAFDLFFASLIILNAFVIAAQMEFLGMQASAALRNGDGDDFEDADNAFVGLEMFFKMAFLVELIARVCAHGNKFLCNWLNWLDIAIVGISLISLFTDGAFVDFTFLRLLRMVKLLRIIRMVRVLKVFSHLRILVGAVVSSLGAVGWSLCLIALVQAMSGLCISQMLNDFIMDENNDMETRRFVFRYYGSFFRAWLTMFQITNGNWGSVGRPLIEDVDPHYAWFFLFYVGILSFAILRVVAALFLRQTLAVATRDEEMMAEEKMKQRSTHLCDLKDVFEKAVSSLDGTVSWEEFEAILRNPKAESCLAHFDLSPEEALGLFHLLDNGDDRMSFDEFAAGLMRVKGPGRHVDVVTILYENQKIFTQLNVLKHELLAIRDFWGIPELGGGDILQAEDLIAPATQSPGEMISNI